ncbi:PREDICTED: uncharacterized protein LOC104589490 [Nelumbo nucifera]|uniref:Uncharacterized protein n=2 Tax=Nelumbo nucifera TaxID=4432 RepID=A0A822Z6A4_NELNU|nr:PREDICTED: uncharacterized protein LOC104589490 [Nelumbo nucifera]DAD38929.1 TPA_asm: hypothetical protein HUJ06_013251 [Nelumbo nucifera]
MESTSKSSGPATKRPSKRLLFDRRYGWVVDDWKDPSEEALAGGRGMFCILPLAKGLIKLGSQSINLAVSSALKVIERPDQFSPQLLQASLNDQFHKFMSSMKGPNFSFFTAGVNSPVLSTSGLQHLPLESSGPPSG